MNITILKKKLKTVGKELIKARSNVAKYGTTYISKLMSQRSSIKYKIKKLREEKGRNKNVKIK